MDLELRQNSLAWLKEDRLEKEQTKGKGLLLQFLSSRKENNGVLKKGNEAVKETIDLEVDSFPQQICVKYMELVLFL